MLAKKILIVSTEQNYKWTSMQEVLPAIENCWLTAAKELEIECKLVNADIIPIRDYSRFLIQADLIVFIAFNETIAKVMRNIREHFNTSAPYVLHLYGHATLGLWPQARFGALEVMNAGDTFIGTCQGDLKCMELTSKNSKTLNIPYPYFETTSSPSNSQTLSFAYIGRISDQKNVDLLIEAYHLLFKKISNLPNFYIYGKEDFFGSPNMGIKSSNCLERITQLIKEYQLEHKVFLKGFQSRETIYQELGSKHIFISASTHSDENFGMALMRSLSVGGLVVASDWGGHKAFKQHAPESVKLSPVFFKNSHPVIDPEHFSKLMEESYLELLQNKKGILPNYFSSQSVVESFKSTITNYKKTDSPLLLSNEAKTIHQQQLNFEKSGDIQKAFTSYQDPIAQLYLSAYAE